ETRTFFRGLTNITLRNELVQELHSLLGLPTDELLRDLTRARSSSGSRSEPRVEAQGDSWDEETVLLALALRGLVPWATLRKRIPEERFSARHRAIVVRLDAGDEGEGSSEEASPEDARAISALMLRELPFDADDEQLLEKAVRDSLNRLVDLPAIEGELHALGERIEDAEKRGDREQVDDLQRAYSELVAKRRSLDRRTSKGEEDAEAQQPS
ncbi:MAG: hypothetical protein JSW65_01230, partial [Candidatus Bipolaricaulota bacterium]